MGKEKNGRARGLFGKVSNLQRFINKYRENYETLSKREVEVLALVANGYKNSEIAGQLDFHEPQFKTTSQGFAQSWILKPGRAI